MRGKKIIVLKSVTNFICLRCHAVIHNYLRDRNIVLLGHSSDVTKLMCQPNTALLRWMNDWHQVELFLYHVLLM